MHVFLFRSNQESLILVTSSLQPETMQVCSGFKISIKLTSGSSCKDLLLVDSPEGKDRFGTTAIH